MGMDRKKKSEFGTVGKWMKVNEKFENDNEMEI